ncbi:MAG TPA: IS1182 family transposase [Segetibacter sp.]|jgi:transposase
MQGRKQHSEKLFISFQLSGWVPEDNFYRKLKNFLDLRWLYKATAKYYGTEGQQSIDPVVFFKLILIGYLENLGSDRRIINTAAMRMDMLFFIGHDLDEPLPWHSTLSRTRQLYGEEVFKQLFKQILKQCIDKGMVAGKRQAIDSVFVKANASMSSLEQKDILEDGDQYAAALTEDEDTIAVKSIDNKEDKNTTDNTVSAVTNKRVQQHHAWKKKAYKGMPGARVNTKEVDKDEEQYQREYLSNKTHFSTTDTDARVSVKPGKPRQLNYLGQVSTDTANHVITNIEAHHADKKDSQCLAQVLENTIDNLHQEGLIVEEVLADAGYSSGEALQSLDDNNIIGYIPNCGQYKANRPGFTYDKENDRYICKQGKHIVFKKIKHTPQGYVMKHYRSSAKDCKNCPFKTTCIGKSNEKKIEDTIDKPLYDKMHVRLQSTKAKRLKKLRSSTVEPVIGSLVTYMAMKRVNTRGIKQANKCMLMAAVAYNLKKLMKWKCNKVSTIVKAMEIKAGKCLLNPFLQLWLLLGLIQLKGTK